MGSVTLGWVKEACKAAMTARNPDWLREIKIPVHIFTAGQDRLINNRFTFEAVKHIPDAQVTCFPRGKHDLPMETDDIRDAIIRETVALADRKPRPQPG
jgi:alpha-beta hydrolase superfamily lysophospholipase